MLNPSNLALASALSLGVLLSGCQSMPTSTSAQSSAAAVTTLDSAKMMHHLQALQSIAAQHGGHRAVGSPVSLATAEYILDQAKAAGLQAQMIPFENRKKAVGQNIIVEIAGQSKDTAVIVGAHYDSVPMGPGINDNGSGVALLLELMHHYATSSQAPKHTLYLAFWDSGQEGIGGSQDFARKLSPEQLNGIQAYINIDMVGTKHPTIQLADGDHSSITEMEQMLQQRGMAEADYKPLTDGLRSIPKHAGDVELEQRLLAFFKNKQVEVK